MYDAADNGEDEINPYILILQWHPEYNFGFESHKSNEECNATDEGASGSMDPDYLVRKNGIWGI